RFALYRDKTASSGISWDGPIQRQTLFVVSRIECGIKGGGDVHAAHQESRGHLGLGYLLGDAVRVDQTVKIADKAATNRARIHALGPRRRVGKTPLPGVRKIRLRFVKFVAS